MRVSRRQDPVSSASGQSPIPVPAPPQSAIHNPQSAISAREAEELREFLTAALAENTRRAYQRDWTDFCAWCLRENVRHLPAAPENLARYLVRLANHGPALLWSSTKKELLPRPEDEPAPCRASTIRRRIASINRAHQARGFDGPGNSPLVRNLQQGIRRKLGTSPRKKAPATTQVVRSLLDSVDPEPTRHDPSGTRAAAQLQAHRDRALILIGFTGCFRRSELAGLQVEDFRFVEEGLEIKLRRSKTDQEARGSTKRLPHSSQPGLCPIRAIRAWWKAAGITSGAAFRSIHRGGRVSPEALTDRAVALIIKKLALRAGLDPGAFAGHSLRSGFATSAAQAGANLPDLMEQGGWKSERIALGYVQDRNAWTQNPATRLGL
jgi:integrase